MAKLYEWHKVGESELQIGLPENGITVVEVNSKKICIAKFNDQWFGFAYTCPHAGGLLANGSIDASGNIVCPLHRYKFNIRNGWNSSGEGYYLKTYPVELRDNSLYVGFEITG